MSLENISDENNNEQIQHISIKNRKKKKRRNKFKKKLTSKSRSSRIKRSNTLDIQNKEDSIDSSISSESIKDGNEKDAFEEIKIGGFLKEQVIKRKVVNIFQSKMSEIPEVKNDNDSCHEEIVAKGIKDEIQMNRRKLSNQSLRHNIAKNKYKQYNKSKFFKKSIK